MARIRTDDDSDGEDEFEGHEAEYHPEADEAGEFWCPECGAVMYADSELCPKCNQYVTPGARPSGPLPRWIWLFGLVLLGLAVAGYALSGLAR